MSYSVIRADLEGNREEILKLWERNLPIVSSNIEKYKWYYQNNPLGPGICWLLRHDESGRFVGTAGLGLRKVKIFDKICLAGIASDFAVDREHRTFLPALMLQKAVLKAAEKEVDFIYGLPNNRATGVMLRGGYKKLGEMVRYTKILDVKPYMRRVMEEFRGIDFLATPVNWAIRLVSRETWRAVREEFVTKKIKQFDERFDALWKRVSPRLSISGERTSAFLRWRYTLCPLQQYSTVGLLSRDENELLGYIVYLIQQNRVAMIDLISDDREGALESLIIGFLQFARQMKADSVSFYLLRNGQNRNALTGFGFHRRKETRSVLVYPGAPDPFSSQIIAGDNWYLTLGDEDFN